MKTIYVCVILCLITFSSPSTIQPTTNEETTTDTGTTTTTIQPTPATDPGITATTLSTAATITTTTPAAPTTEGTKSPEIANQPIVVNLLESTRVQTELACITCTDPDGGDIAVRITSISPQTTISDSSFTAWKDTGATDYCVLFIPGQSDLSYNEAPIVTLQLECFDGVDPPTTANMEVRLQPNYPPKFQQSIVTVNVPDSESKTKTDVLYTVLSTDVTTGDNLTYSMTSSPDAGYFVIDPGTGEIKSSQDLSTLCDMTSSQLDVMVTDGFNDPVGPMKITLNLDDVNTPPSLSNMNREILVGEHALADKKTTLFTVEHDDTFILNNQLQYTLVVMPTEYSAYFVMKGDDLMLLHDLNYEIQPSFNITVFPSDGYCAGPPSWIKIQVTNENDPITLSLGEPLGNVDEGLITFDPIPQFKDEDRLDSPVYSIVGSNSRFTIDKTTGVISSIGEYDMDGSNPGIVKLLIRATDKGGNYSETGLTLNIDEINDNRPQVVDKGYLAEAMSCSEPSKLGISLPTPTDGDKKGSINKQVDYLPVSSGPMMVTKDGDVYLTSTPKTGFYSVEVFATDHGVKPGPLISSKSVTVNLVITPCTTTPPPVTKAITKQPVASVNQNPVFIQQTSAPIQQVDTSSDFDLEYLWIALGSLLGLLLLGLLAYMLYRCCCAGGRSSCGHGCGQRCCYERASTPVTPKNKVHPSTPVKEAYPENEEGELYDFWKEHYMEEDIIIEPSKYNTLPVTMGTRY